MDGNGDNEGGGGELEWSAFYDDDGNVYYYNSRTEESSWDAPEAYNPLPPRDGGDEPEGGDGGGGDDGDDGNNDGNNEGQDGAEELEWSAHYDDDGNVYYYNSRTEESAWEAPERFNPLPPRDDAADDDANAAVAENGNANSEGDASASASAAMETEPTSPPANNYDNDHDDRDRDPHVAASGDREGGDEGSAEETSGAVDGNGGANDQQDEELEWSAFYDDDGNLYYYNNKTDESAWDPPAKFNPPPSPAPDSAERQQQSSDNARDGDDDDDSSRANKNDPAGSGDNDESRDAGSSGTGNDDSQAQDVERSSSQASEGTHEWSAFHDDDGNLYYYNNTTGESAWDPPEKFNPPPPRDSGEGQDADGTSSTAHSDRKADQADEDQSNDQAKKADSGGDGEKTKGSDDGKMKHEWSAFYDASGQLYYCNEKTGESSWDPPEHYNPPPAAGGDAVDAAQDAKSGPEADARDSSEGASKTTSGGPWVAYKDSTGLEYYFNTETSETTWDKPDGVIADADQDDSDAGPTSPQQRSPSPEPDAGDDGDAMDVDAGAAAAKTKDQEEEPAEPVIDPAVQRLQDARDALNKRDAIMEKGIMSDVTEVVGGDGGPKEAIQALINSFYGQTTICGLVCRWLADLKSDSISSGDDRPRVFESTADAVRQRTQDVVYKIVKERFTVIGGDSILALTSAEVVFLEDMMDSPRWRKLLIDLSAVNKNSALLMYCLQAISKRGHHREIAKRINQSDHFSVFNAMLVSELSVIGKISVTSGKESDTSIGLRELVENLRRTCTSTAYTYIYAIEVLKHLVHHARESDRASDPRFMRVIGKWQRLSEDLQTGMVDPNTNLKSSNPLYRKRRLDIAMVVDPLHQRQRRKLDPSAAPDDANLKKRCQVQKMEAAALDFLQKYAFGTRVDDRLLDQMLPTSGPLDDALLSKELGRICISHPMIVRGLIGSLFRPGSQRVATPTTRQKCARLTAITTLEVERAEQERSQPNGGASANADPEQRKMEFEALSKDIAEASQLCETLETMVSFVVTRVRPTSQGVKANATAGANTATTGNANANGTANGSAKKAAPPSAAPAVATSPGQRLCTLAIKCPSVARGVCMWAKEVTKGADFVTSASYPTLSPSILSLIRISSMEHPFACEDATAIAMSFLNHSNSDVSYQKMNAIKEQSLRLLLVMCIKGDPTTVIDCMTDLLEKGGNTSVDAALIRYFVGGLLQIIRPPYSVPFTRCLCRMLKSKGCVSSVGTDYFGAENKQLLGKLIGGMQGVVKTEELSGNDRTLVDSVSNLYRKTIASA